MNQPLTFSIIIPTYNRAHLIVKTLESVLSQSIPAKEIIVVDNCSTDNTQSLLKSYIEKGRIRWLAHDRNYERAKSRNTGLEAATGDYVTFLDSDDLLYPDCLKDARDAIVRNPTYKLFHCLYELVDSNRTVLHRYRYPSLKDCKKAIMWGNFLSCIGTFLHREIYSNYRFSEDPTIIASEDWEFWIRVMADYKLFRIEKTNCAIVHHPSRTVTQSNAEETARRRFRIIEKIKSDPHLTCAYEPYLSSLPAHSLAFVATVANANLQFGLALKYLLQAASYDLGIIATRKFFRTLLIALLRINPLPPFQPE